ncbi:MAG: SDR family oxidoreductase, partial [Solirubrobacterales bacterium]
MRVFLTGATGFIGGHVARKLAARGDDVVALARDPDKARDLEQVGCELVVGDLSDTAAIRAGMLGADAV